MKAAQHSADLSGMATRFTQLSLSDTRMDQVGACFGGPEINTLPIRCPRCRFPELDFIPQPYFVLRGPASTPQEIRESANGHLLVRERLKRILEAVIPDQFRSFPTTFSGTTETAPWWLIVPIHRSVTDTVSEKIPRCPECGEPESAHPGSEHTAFRGDSILEASSGSPAEIFQSANWHSLSTLKDGGHQDRFPIRRTLWMSLRLCQLLQQLKVAGLRRLSYSGKDAPLTAAEATWGTAQMSRLDQSLIAIAPKSLSAKSEAWFRAFIRANQGRGCDPKAIAAMEKKHKATLPKTYVEFATAVGGKELEFSGHEEMGTVTICAFANCDFESFRQGELDSEDEEVRKIDAVCVATVSNGDRLCLQVGKRRSETPVLLYRHEYDDYEPFADNFVECLKMLVAQTKPKSRKTAASNK